MTIQHSTYDEACEAFEALPDSLKHAHFSPAYVMADATRDGAIIPCFFIYNDDGGVFYHAFHVRDIADTDYRDIESPYGYGGPLVWSDDPGFAARGFRQYREWCADMNVVVEFIRFHPHLHAWDYYDGESYANRKTVWIDTSTPPELFSGFNMSQRYHVRKILASDLHAVEVDYKTFRPVFTAMYYETMQHAHATQFYYFPDEYFAALGNVESVYILVANGNGDYIGGTIGLFGGTHMEYHLCALNDEGRRKRAGALQIHSLREAAYKRNFNYLNLGGGTDGSEDNKLLEFKKQFSKNIELFHIGKYIVRPDIYGDLKRKWEQKTGKTTDLTIFYR